MLVVDSGGKVLYANSRVADLFGCQREDIVDQSVDLLLPERFRARHAGHRRHFSEDRRTRPMGVGLDLLGRRWDGTEFPVEISLSPLRDGLAAAAIRDVTDRKRVEHELIKARESADSAREEADRANLSNSRFLATASHDLRQPLQALSMLHGTLRRMETAPAFQEALSQQGLAIDAMKRLLNALLDISKLESGAVKPQPCVFPLKRLFAREHPDIDLLVSDYHLKENQTGLDVITAIRDTLARNIPAILVTGDTSTAIRKLPRDAGLRLASKPIDADELLTLIPELLRGRAAD